MEKFLMLAYSLWKETFSLYYAAMSKSVSLIYSYRWTFFTPAFLACFHFSVQLCFLFRYTQNLKVLSAYHTHNTDTRQRPTAVLNKANRLVSLGPKIKKKKSLLNIQRELQQRARQKKYEILEITGQTGMEIIWEFISGTFNLHALFLSI